MTELDRLDWGATPAAADAFGGVLRSVLVPAGASRTMFRYEPVPFLRGRSCRES